ncbi:MAG: benzoate/H(+) symporter BenE family transporter, partial [Actinomycetota bacterium]
GLTAMGATSEQTATALFVLLVGYGVLSIGLSYWLKMPVSVVWSTPGAAFLASSAALDLEFNIAAGAFLVSSLLIVLTGVWPFLGNLVRKIPPAISAAMLAGVIFPFVLSIVHSAVDYPALIIPIVILWLLLNRFLTVWASPIAIGLGFFLIGTSSAVSEISQINFWPELSIVSPVFDLAAIVAIGIPLYLVTMASQNLPGLAIMSSLGYNLPTGKVFASTGTASAITAFFGGFGLNLAAITAALNADEGASKDPSRRWIASSFGGVVYILFAFFAAPFAAFVLAVPRELLLSLAGIALINTFAGSLRTAMEGQATRLAAVITFLIGAAGVTIFGIGGAFWALVAGVLVWLLGPRS